MIEPPPSAFSLVELSIVLVILGLLTGGILAGKSLIRASELRSVVNERGRYSTAIMAFRDKYFYFPGDIPNATSIWPSATYGDGDGFIGSPVATGGSSATQTGMLELYKAWDHLAQSGLIEGSYTGTSGAAHTYRNAITGVNVPASRLNNGAWCFGPQYTGWRVNADYTNTLTIGNNSGTTDLGYCANPVFLAEEAWNIDTKLDDGMPGRGKVIATPSANTCTTAHTTITNLDGTYVISGTNASVQNCNLNFKFGT